MDAIPGISPSILHYLKMWTTAFLLLSLLLGASEGLVSVGSKGVQPLRSRGPETKLLQMVPADLSHNDLYELFDRSSSVIVAYSDEVAVSPVSGVTVGLILAVAVGTGLLFTSLGKQLKSSPQGFQLTSEERDIVDITMDIFDPLPADRELTESGIVGAVRRKELSRNAIENYQKGKSIREARGKTLTYAEIDLGFLATLLRFVNPSAGENFVDIGSGVGRACVMASKLCDFGTCTGIELLPELHNKAKSTKVGGGRTKYTWINQDFMDPSVTFEAADVILAYSTYFASTGGYLTELSEKLAESTKLGARIITIDTKLRGPFKLLKTIDDPRGDLQLNRGYVWERV